jgi:hypothetical protein
MKKSVLIALFGAASVVAYGQGNVVFSNYYSSQQVTGISYGNGPASGLGVGPEISVELLYGAATDTAISQLTALAISISPVGINGVTGPGVFNYAGYNNAYSGTGVFSAGNVLVPGTPGSTYAFALYAFGNFTAGPGGNGIYKGWSAIFTGTTQASAIVGAPTLPDGLRQASFTVNEIVSTPEPSSLALAGLGGFGMLMAFRRKKA